MEKAAGRQIDVNSSYRDWNVQYKLWQAWVAYESGRGPWAPRALHPDQSMHCRGLAFDTDDSALVRSMSDHGWRFTASDEPWHAEYQSWNDKRVGEGAGGGAVPLPRPEPGPAPEPVPDDPVGEDEEMALRMMHWSGGSVVTPTDKVVKLRRALSDTSSGYFVEWTEGDSATYANSMARSWSTGSSAELTQSLANAIYLGCVAIRG